jgi:hypothetical protein
MNPQDEYRVEARLATLEEDPDAPDDGKVLIAGVLYDAETGEEAVEPCAHENVLKDDDGRDNWFYVCDDCEEIVVDDGEGNWVTQGE